MKDNSSGVRSTNVVWHEATILRMHRETLNSHKSAVVWFTGLSGSGKSTLAHLAEDALHRMDCRTYVLDGDNVRHGLCADLGFSQHDREENIRRIGEVSKLFIDAGVLVLTAFISPFRADRERVRKLVGAENFIEIYCRCPVEVCEQRDVKGLYQKARQGLIAEFTGISSPYEAPQAPDLEIDTSITTPAESLRQIIELLIRRGVVPQKSD
jgi:adenylylsulfate kinase